MANKKEVISEEVEYIENFAFEECRNLTKVIIPESITHIGSYAFYLCSNLANIAYCGTKEEWNDIYKGNGWDDYIESYTIVYNYT